MFFRQKLTAPANMNLKYLLFSEAKNVDSNGTARQGVPIRPRPKHPTATAKQIVLLQRVPASHRNQLIEIQYSMADVITYV